MMLMHHGDPEEAHFCGTAFVIHRDGYLLAASVCVDEDEELLAVPAYPAGGFIDATMEEVTPVPDRVVRTDAAQGLALLRFIPDMRSALLWARSTR